MKLIVSFRLWRWLACAAVVPVLWACNARKLVAPPGEPRAVEQKDFVQSLNRSLDIIFMIDNSSSMDDFQAALAANLQSFMTPLETLPGGLPDLHLGIISSSMGAGAFSVSGCGNAPLENDDGAFQTAPRDNPKGCTGLRPSEKFIIANAKGEKNFANPQNSVAQVFGCLALLGAKGCGFEHQFHALRRALERAQDPGDPRNGGFLRPDAYLAIVMLTNEDDCSAPNSDLFDPSQLRNNDPLGGFSTGYRCAEFGYLCDGRPPPRNITGRTPLANCSSAEDKGRLLSVKETAAFIKSLKPDDPEKIFVAALMAPTNDVFAELLTVPLPGSPTPEQQPSMGRSCTAPNPIPGGPPLFGYPGIRIAELVREFGEANGLVRDVCKVTEYPTSMRQIADALSILIGAQCVTGDVRTTADGEPDCRVIERKRSEGGEETTDQLPYCAPGAAIFPCWRFGDAAACQARGGGRPLEICRESGCDQTIRPPESINAKVSCSILLD